MRRNKQAFFVLLFTLAFTPLFSQDQHFTQFYAAPLTLNPALTGAFDGKYRLAMVYRDQGRNILDDPYVTFAAAMDLRFPLKIGKSRRDAAGMGVLFFNDRNATVNFFTNSIAVSGGFHKSLNREGTQYLSAGAQIGVVQRNINYDNITFNDQFNGVDGYTGVSREDLPENNFSFGDIAVGINYSYAPRKGIGFFAGGAIHHITEPQVSFYASQTEPTGINDNQLHRKYTGHIGLSIPLGEAVQFLPRAQAYLQGPHLAMNAGANFRFLINDIQGTALHVGGWARPVRNIDQSYAIDAAVVMAGLEFNNFLLGLSYDARTSTLNTGGQRSGAFEITFAFLGNYDNETIQCPKF